MKKKKILLIVVIMLLLTAVLLGFINNPILLMKIGCWSLLAGLVVFVILQWLSE